MSEESGSGCWSAGSAWQGATLLSARLRLRPLAAADAPRLVEALADGQVSRLTARIPHPYALADAEAFLALQERRRRAGLGVVLGLERTVDRALIGAIGFDAEDGRRAEVSYWLAREAWGQGYMAEALRRLVRHLFADLSLESVWAAIHPDNDASARVLAKAGFLRQGDHACAMPAREAALVVAAPRFVLAAADWRAAHQVRPHLLVVAAALIDTDGRVLMATRPPGKAMSGLWEFPGGKMQAGETPEAALVRELAEELGIDVGESCLAPLAFASHDYDTFHLLMPLYAVRQWRGEARPLEGQSLRWVRSEALSGLPMPPADIPLVALLREWL